jgi:hypothetical protein
MLTIIRYGPRAPSDSELGEIIIAWSLPHICSYLNAYLNARREMERDPTSQKKYHHAYITKVEKWVEGSCC